MTFVAARTSRLRLVSSVMILPYRNPVLTAKILATVDVLSGGRVTAGVGVGWLEEEFEAVGAPPFARRGAVSDERSEEHTSELQSLMRISYAVFCLKKKKIKNNKNIRRREEVR